MSSDTLQSLGGTICNLVRYGDYSLRLTHLSSRDDVRNRLDQIRRLPGIGPKRFQEIVDWVNGVDVEARDLARRRAEKEERKRKRSTNPVLKCARWSGTLRPGVRDDVGRAGRRMAATDPRKVTATPPA